MGILTKYRDRRRARKSLNDVFEQMRLIQDDEEFQLDMLSPEFAALLRSMPAWDVNPDGVGSFGFADTNAIPVNGAIGQLAYLSRLETSAGQRLLFHRIGAINTIDAFEAVAFDGSEWFILFLDLYHPHRSRMAPEGFHFTEKVPQFSGFQRFCPDFPYDFIEQKIAEQESGLSVAYIAMSQVGQQLERRAFDRPVAHNAKLELVRNRLTSLQT